MTYRERLADLLTGGALTRAREDAARAEEHTLNGYYGLRTAHADLERRNANLLKWGNERHADWLKASDALRAIIAQERPTSNATVKRCARIAREALGE
jgi:hypothetical protein